MNERIEQLAEQAGYHPDVFEMCRSGMEKFAELIVQDCAKIAKKEQAFNARYTDAHLHPQVNIDQCILIEFGL
jgi:hypothetical protein